MDAWWIKLPGKRRAAVVELTEPELLALARSGIITVNDSGLDGAKVVVKLDDVYMDETLSEYLARTQQQIDDLADEVLSP